MKRFYEQVSVSEVNGGWQVMLDDRGLKTVGGKAQIVPTKPLAEALAREWDEQGEDIDVKRFRLRDTADYAIEHVAAKPDEVITKLLGYVETDTLCYRADPEDALFQRQLDEWEPILENFEAREGLKLVRVSGIVHREQPQDTLAKLRAKLEMRDPFPLAGLELLASLAASLIVALEISQPESDPEMLWRAASLEEEWQAELWGRDAQAEERRAERRIAFLGAADWLKLLEPEKV
ncbi:ATP12 family chaperone protein [Altererythrobacter lutimaris]|uniref:Molecular chaperone n=1 Tax=Altererythrobacter lutimaris TaxID=2743979 RepID=A0A850HAM2_9SPHN|nr:ATP12 family protein [Altererythrobacter lutimaris]NVE94779.1 molecular chaperone [Altererythrobacter lutimaris]